MKKLFQILFVFAIVNVAFLTGCKESTDDDPAAKTEYEILSEYLVASGMDLDHVIKSAEGNKFVAFPADASAAASRYVIDIRSPESFGQGHVEGAVNVPIADLLTEAAKAGDKQDSLFCYCPIKTIWLYRSTGPEMGNEWLECGNRYLVR